MISWKSKADDMLPYFNSRTSKHKVVSLLMVLQVKDYVTFLRRGKEHITRIIVVELSQLEYYAYYDTIRTIMDSAEFNTDNALLTHPEGFSVEYNILMNSKLSLLHTAARENRFRSRYFFWVDAGYGHGKDVFPKSCSWSPRNIMRHDDDRVTHIELSDLTRIDSVYTIYKRPIPPFINGGFFGGSAKALAEYYQLHKKVFERLLQQNMVDDDQTVAIACYFANPELFNMVPGSWYDAFNMFH